MMKKIKLLFLLLLAHSAAYCQDYWQKVSSGTGKDLLHVSFGSSSTGYIGGVDSTLLKTTDGGKTWTALHHTGLTYSAAAHDIIDIRFVSANTGFAIISDRNDPSLKGILHKTTDGGHSWTALSIPMAAYCSFFFDENNGYLLGSGFFIGSNVSKLNAGTWEAPKYFSFNSADFLYAVDFFNPSTGIVGGANGYVYRTFDAGLNWDTVKTNIDTAIRSLLYIDENTILATGDYIASILISKDKGANWTIEPHSATFFYPLMKAMARSSRDSVIIVGNSVTTTKGIIYYFDPAIAGMDIASAEQWLNHVTVRDGYVGYIVGDSGLILSNEKSVVSVSGEPTLQQSLQVYPNPSSGEFYTRLPVVHTVLVYDLQGKAVYRDNSLKAAHSLNLGSLPKGTYILEAISSDRQKATINIQLK